MGATTIMVIRHAEKPGDYDRINYDGVYDGVQTNGTANSESLVTLGWERAGGLVTLFAPPWGPQSDLATPQSLFAADPSPTSADSNENDSSDEPSQRPYETLTAIAAMLDLSIDTQYAKDEYKDMVTAALDCTGVVLIAWQHQDIPWVNKKSKPGISQYILTDSQTPSGKFNIPSKWPGDRCDLVWVFDRPSGSGPITTFTQVPQLLLAGDRNSVIPYC